ncbi:hypothetical protein QTP70_003967 [Hemibagrus guttatus]|uniref:Reverse transcriptase RNase H-like domain-containing protein n=1 Tax=Hemibagrus guttatus TaxID=175788 RepID=A0AAE0RE93_9TELE|nr:hypothetical protein QTP70_003967 [Hemibagrus guttatus]
MVPLLKKAHVQVHLKFANEHLNDLEENWVKVLWSYETLASTQLTMFGGEGMLPMTPGTPSPGRALDWASAVWDSDPQIKTSANYFAEQIRDVFEYLAGGKDVSVQLLELLQGSDSAADYTIKFHTFAAQSGKLTAAEANYDVGNHELLSNKVALEEWCHWLEGARHLFLVLTDHRNLKYLRGAKRLNPSQACWALFFMWFQFSVTYPPGSKNSSPAGVLKSSPSPRLHSAILTHPSPHSVELGG